jgi:pyruvate,orthophosphate dikinase
MILAESSEERQAALDRLLPIQRADFKGIFKAMKGLPVTVRLMDPPLHEFLPTAANSNWKSPTCTTCAIR